MFSLFRDPAEELYVSILQTLMTPPAQAGCRHKIKGVVQLWENLDRGLRDGRVQEAQQVHKRKNGPLTGPDPGWR